MHSAIKSCDNAQVPGVGGSAVLDKLRQRVGLSAVALAEWHPWVLAIVLGCLLSGVRGITNPPDPRLAIDRLVGDPYYTLYYLALIVGGVVLLGSSTFRGLRDRLMVEQIGLWIVSGVLLIYQLAIIIRLGSPAGVAASITLLIAIGGLGRIWRIMWELRQLNRGSP